MKVIDIDVNNVTLNYGFKTILDGVSFQINSGDKVAIIGPNGAGKTSIFKIIAGLENPNNGNVTRRKDITIGYLSQIPPKEKEGVTVREFLKTAFLRLKTIQDKMKELEEKMCSPTISSEELESVIEKYGKYQDEFANAGGYNLDPDVEKVANNLNIGDLIEQEYEVLSGGQKTIVCLARLILQSPDLLLLDEPTNHLDIYTLSWLEDFIKNYKGSVILVSHDRYFLDKTITKVFAIDKSKIKTYFGNYTAYVELYKQEMEAQEQAYVTQQKKIASMEETIRKNRAWGAASSEKAYKVAKQLERKIDEMDKVERPREQRGMALNFNQETRSGKKVLLFEDVSFAYGDLTILKDGNFEIAYQEKVGIIGPNGCGKTTIIELVLQNLKPSGGTITIGSNVKIGYLPQHTTFENENLTVLEEFQKHVNDTTTRLYSKLAAFHFYGEEVHKRVKSLSGGEKVRLKFAELVQSEINLLILDEPTNHLDIRNREILEEALGNFEGTVLFVSHDRYFINKVADRLLELKDGHLINYLGNYDFYLEHKR